VGGRGDEDRSIGSEEGSDDEEQDLEESEYFKEDPNKISKKH
jgi:hypothetical protein